jgi:ferredoxin
MSEQVEITIHHKGTCERHQLRKGLGLQALCAREKTPIELDCREADCGICLVRVLSGADHLSPMTPAEKDFLKAMHADPDERLSCQCRVLGDVELFVDEF